MALHRASRSRSYGTGASEHGEALTTVALCAVEMRRTLDCSAARLQSPFFVFALRHTSHIWYTVARKLRFLTHVHLHAHQTWKVCSHAGTFPCGFPLPEHSHTPCFAASALAASCWPALCSSLTRCLAEPRVSSCAMPWSDTQPSSSSVKRGIASVILP